MKDKVNYTIKILYMLGIIFIVDGHITNSNIFTIAGLFPYYSFHVSLFIFASGYLYSHKNEINIFNYIKKKFKKLIIPLFFWNIVYGILANFMNKFMGFEIGQSLSFTSLFILPLIDGHQFFYNLATWFIFPLFLTQIVNVVIRFINNNLKIIKSEYIYLFFFTIVGIIGIKLSSLGYNTGIWLATVRTMIFLMFFEFGIFYKEKIEKHDILSNYIYFPIILVLQLILLLISNNNISYSLSLCNDFHNGSLITILSSINAIAFWLRISKILTPILKENKIVMKIADNTFNIMIHHIFAFMIVKTIFYIIIKLNILEMGFNISNYKSDIWYYYFPIPQFNIIYLIVGITIPIIIGSIINKIQNKF